MWEILQETCLLDGLFPGIRPNIKDFSQKAVDSFSPPPLAIILCVPGEMVRRVRRGEPLKEVRSFSKLLLQLHHGDTVLPLAVAAQAEALHLGVAAQQLLDRLAQGAGTLAVDDAHRV